MKTPTLSHGYHRTNLSSLTRIAAFFALVALIGIPLFSSSSASSTSKYSRALPISRLVSDKGAAINSNGIFGHFLNAGKQPALLPFSPALAETIATFAADCTTPKTTFVLGETVCAQTDNVDLNFLGGRWVNWLRQDLSIAHGGSGTTLITMNPQTFSFAPDALGTWKVTIAETGDISQTPAVFTVSQSVPLATYAADCVTPKSTFNLGDVVCAKVSGLNLDFSRSFSWVDPAGFGRQVTPIATPTQTDSYTLPGTETSLIGGVFVVDNRGTWKVNVVSSRNSVVLSQPFNVQGATMTADLSLVKSINGGSPDEGTNFSYNVAISNNGPNDAANVVFTDPQPLNATFVSASPISGPTFNCTGTNPVVCTRASFAAGDTALLELTYTAGLAGATITNVATVSSDTVELNAADNTASSGRVTIGGGGGTPPTCSLECPNDITVATNTVGGANVTFPSAATFGDCGTVTTNHASGSFFAIGTTLVTATSSTGGGSCTFNVTVIDVPSPTITCPPDQTVAAPSGQSEVTVATGSPTATGSGLEITSSRSDERPLTDPFPVGTTFITWTAKDQFDRQVNCTQKIVVTSADAPTITCPSDKTFTAGTGSCTFTATAVQIGTPTTGGVGVTVTSDRSDDQALTDPYPAGQTFITWTATNSLGSASCTQKITVIATDNTPPTLTVPSDVNATTDTCSATLDDELGVATATDNCTASVDITRTGVPRVACPIPGDPGRTCESFVFPTGTTIVTYTAKDAAGNTTIGTQLVTVLESPAIPPTITAPANATYQCASEVPAANPNQATASDNCSVTVTVAQTDNGGAGTTASPLVITRTFTAKDPSNNMASAVQTITVIDNTPPVVTPPGPVTLFTGPGATSCGVTVTDLNGTLGTGSATDNCSGVGPVTRGGVPAGNFFPVGPTTLTYSATDAHGNTSSANQIVTVVDNTPPTISCQANIIADFDAAVNGAVVTYVAPVGTDNCASTTTQIAGLPSGSTFPTGTTTNTFRVTDASGNTAECSFKVTVAVTSIIGLDSVTLSGNVVVDSYDSTIGYPASKGSLANLLSNGTITISGSSKMFGNVRSTRVGVSVLGTSQINGNATAGTTVTKAASAVITGTITNNALAPVMTMPTVPACGPPYSPNSGISGTYSYNSSTGDLSLSGINVATLANGTYCFHNITMTNSGQLKVNGPVSIKMTGTFNAGGASTLNNTTLIPANLRILSSNSGSNGVIFSNGNSAYLLIYAPQTGVTNSGSAPLFGTIVGKTITISNSGMVHYDTKLKTIWPDIWTLIFGP